jgi:hypothetical protein
MQNSCKWRPKIAQFAQKFGPNDPMSNLNLPVTISHQLVKDQQRLIIQTTDKMEEAIKTLESSFERIASDLAVVEQRLSNDLSSRIAPGDPTAASCNPAHLVERIRAIEATLPALLEKMRMVTDAKLDLVDFCSSELRVSQELLAEMLLKTKSQKVAAGMSADDVHQELDLAQELAQLREMEQMVKSIAGTTSSNSSSSGNQSKKS